jgi:hypothetical protein
MAFYVHSLRVQVFTRCLPERRGMTCKVVRLIDLSMNREWPIGCIGMCGLGLRLLLTTEEAVLSFCRRQSWAASRWLPRLVHPQASQSKHGQFTAISGDRITYELLSSSSEATTTVAYRLGNITVSVPENHLKKWAGSNDVGVYAKIALGDNQALSVAIEKDFACLDLSDAENEDTFPNPNFSATC